MWGVGGGWREGSERCSGGKGVRGVVVRGVEEGV